MFFHLPTRRQVVNTYLRISSARLVSSLVYVCIYMGMGVGFVAMRNFEPLKRLQVREPLLTNLAGVWHRRLLPVIPGIQSTLSGSHLILFHHKWLQSRKKKKGQSKEGGISSLLSSLVTELTCFQRRSRREFHPLRSKH